ncbi:MAG: zinc ABC transporter substrate-binding protein, partial [Clostridium sp.]|nr:zinc ABC transporter substrate-binding protein [Clostridium sp.]
MKKCILVLVSAALAVTLCACGSSAKTTSTTAAQASAEKAAETLEASSEGGAQTGEEKELKIVATIFPEYDWVREVLGEEASHAELTMLLDSGVDLHSYQPTAKDIMKTSTCDFFIYVGGESDGWVDDALKEAVNPDMKVM